MLLVPWRSSCCTPRVQVMIFGETRSGIRLEVPARASACVAGGTFTERRPPPPRNPCPESTFDGSQVLHHAGAPGRAQVTAGFCSVWSCGGKLLIAKLLGITS